ncbi:MAG: penicillin-binding protein 1C [Deltaproteobacteria bacterium]|nr:penicillin-binding protein 1C [Deltaproteobacteria bacterium]
MVFRLTRVHKSAIIGAPLILFLAALLLNPLPSAQGIDRLKHGESLTILSRDGDLLRKTLARTGGRRLSVPLQDVSDNFVKVLLDTEDRFFYWHAGVNPIALVRALRQWWRSGQVVSGGSTITMQLARMINRGPRCVQTKIKETLFAVYLEMAFTKDEILELYINHLPFSNEIYGVNEASRLYFKKRPRDLTLQESAYLLGIIRAPAVYNPYKNNVQVLALKDKILRSYLNNTALSHGERARLLSEKIPLYPLEMRFLAPHFTDHVINHAKERGDQNNGQIRTSLDLELNEEVQKVIIGQINALTDKRVSQASALVIENRTGEILSYVGSTGYWNDRAQGMIDGIHQKRQPGSALKPFTYARALDAGISPSHVLPDVVTAFPSEIGDYIPENYDRKSHGPVLMRVALANSLNVPAVHLLQEIGLMQLYQALKKLKFAGLTQPPSYYGLGLTLGNVEVSLYELVRAYAVFARGGLFCDLTFTNTDGASCVREDQEGRALQRIFSDQASYIIRDFLSDGHARTISFGGNSPLDFEYPVMIKTGTSQNYRDNWTVAVTPEYTVGVWVGNFNGDPMQNVSGVTGAAPLAHKIVAYLYARHKWTGWHGGEGLKKNRLCSLSGKRPHKYCPYTRWEFTPDVGMEACEAHVIKKIDTRNNQLARRSCPQAFVRERLFVNLPVKYSTWQREHMADALIPAQYSPLCEGREKGEAPLKDHAQILSPQDGVVYKIDYHRPLDAQYLSIAHTGLSGDYQIILDGRPVSTEQTARLILNRGTHHIKLIGAGQQEVDAVRFFVR